MSPTQACDSVRWGLLRDTQELLRSSILSVCQVSIYCVRRAQQALRHLKSGGSFARQPSYRAKFKHSSDRRAILRNGALKRLPQNVPAALVAAQHDAGVCDC